MFADSASHRLRRVLLAATLGLVLVVAALPGAGALQFDAARVQQHAAARYGASAAAVVSRWFEMLTLAAPESEAGKLRRVNDFWNTTVRGGEDRGIWGQEDYWATPLETLGKRWGDCEDFVIGKYFSLIHLGVPAEKLRLVYVRARLGGAGSSQSIAHMVLGYYETPSSDPLVLDNLMGSVAPASQRRDLTPVFSFNAQGIYVAGAAPASVERISRWRGLLARMQEEGFQP